MQSLPTDFDQEIADELSDYSSGWNDALSVMHEAITATLNMHLYDSRTKFTDVLLDVQLSLQELTVLT